jgi:cytidylate kinase
LKKIVIAIDGPAASGKSTTARLVAERLGYLHVDTGAMYRAVALKVLERGIDASDTDSIEDLIESTAVTVKQVDGTLHAFLDGVDVTDKIRSPEVARAASSVSVIPKVREAMVKEQRRLGKDGGIVLEGRDIGTVVFPEADLKIYLTAALNVRAQRRQKELNEQGVAFTLDAIEKEIVERDRKDTTRNASPLTKPPGAIEIDTSNMTIEEQVNIVVGKARDIIRRGENRE